jgi:hypothetical protein
MKNTSIRENSSASYYGVARFISRQELRSIKLSAGPGSGERAAREWRFGRNGTRAARRRPTNYSPRSGYAGLATGNSEGSAS